VVAGPNTLSLVGTDGVVRATISVAPTGFRPNAYVSWTSTSLTRLYFLTASNEVRFLGADGSSGSEIQIKVLPNEEAGFAVSPDGKRIAISIFSYDSSSAYNGMRLYVEDLQGGGHHVDIFDSKTVAEFPIGWTGGNLVLAVTEPRCCEPQPLTPMARPSSTSQTPTPGGGLQPCAVVRTGRRARSHHLA
jgi:hypothetical protein